MFYDKFKVFKKFKSTTKFIKNAKIFNFLKFKDNSQSKDLMLSHVLVEYLY